MDIYSFLDYEFWKYALTMQDIQQRHREQWRTIEEKAKDIFDSGGVVPKEWTPSRAKHFDKITQIKADVVGDNGIYETSIMIKPGTKRMTHWRCSCLWGAYAWDRSPHITKRDPKYNWSSRLNGRMCSHALALNYYYQSGKMQNLWEEKRKKKKEEVVMPEPVKKERILRGLPTGAKPPRKRAPKGFPMTAEPPRKAASKTASSIDVLSDMELFHQVQNEHQRYEVQGAKARNIDKIIKSKNIDFDSLSPEELRKNIENLFL
jgi:hypothetical protein